MRPLTLRPFDQSIQGLPGFDHHSSLENNLSLINPVIDLMDGYAHGFLPIAELPEVRHHPPVLGERGMMNIDAPQPGQVDQLLFEYAGGGYGNNEVEIQLPKSVQEI